MSIEQGNHTPEGTEDRNQSEPSLTEPKTTIHEITPEGINSHSYTPEEMAQLEAQWEAKREQDLSERNVRLEKEIQEIKANKEELTDPEAQQYLKNMRHTLLQVGRDWASAREYWGLHHLVLSLPLTEERLDRLVEDASELAEQITIAETGEAPAPEKTLEVATEIVKQEEKKDYKRNLKAHLEGYIPGSNKPRKEWYPDEYKKLEAEDL